MRTYKQLLLMAMLMLAFSIPAITQTIPKYISCQAALVFNGKAVPAGTYDVTFTLITDPLNPTTSGLWSETQTVRITNSLGILDIQLGKARPLDKQDNGKNLVFDKPMWIEIRYSGSGIASTNIAAVPLLSVPYAFVAERALIGPKLESLENVAITGTPTDKQVLAYDAATEKWTAMNDQLGPANGGIQQLNGLTSSSITLKGGTGVTVTEDKTTSEIIITATGGGTGGTTITSTDGSINAQLSGSNYDLSVKNISLDKIAQGGAANGQVLKWNNGKWEPGTDLTGGGTGGGVTSLNTREGAVSIIAADNSITIDSTTNAIKISAKSGSGGVTKLNGETGDVKIEAKTDGGVTIETDGKTINISLAPGTEEGQTLKWDNTGKKWKQVVLEPETPVGTVMAYYGDMYGVDSLPGGWLPCFGQPIPPRYAKLRELLGTNAVPDLRGMFLRGGNKNSQGASRTDSLKDPDEVQRTGGLANSSLLKIGSVQRDGFQGHWHRFTSYHYPAAGTGSVLTWYEDQVGGSGVGIKDDRVVDVIADGNHPNFGIPRTTSETRPSNVYVNWIIKAR